MKDFINRYVRKIDDRIGHAEIKDFVMIFSGFFVYIDDDDDDSPVEFSSFIVLLLLGINFCINLMLWLLCIVYFLYRGSMKKLVSYKKRLLIERETEDKYSICRCRCRCVMTDVHRVRQTVVC